MHSLVPYVVAVSGIFLLAGGVKGITGMGLPTVSMGLLGLLMPPAEAASLLIIPSLITNIWQFLAGRRRLASLHRLWPMLTAILLATWLAAGLIARTSTPLATMALGLALLAYATLALCNVHLRVRADQELWLSPLVGMATGVVTGATGVFVIPAVPYVQALGLQKDDLVQALGLSFTVSTVALAAGLASYNAFHLHAAGSSIACTAPALCGMMLGRAARAKIDPPTFSRVFFAGLLLLGTDLVSRAWV